MKQQLEAIRKTALDAISNAGKAEDLEALRVRYLGKKGELTAVLKPVSYTHLTLPTICSV